MTSHNAAIKRQGLALLWTFALLVAQFQTIDWQASGSFEPGQLEFVREAIDNAFDDGLTKKAFSLNVTAVCNARYDRFWNVVNGKTRQVTDDAVVFGYAYRQHWFWINNYRGGYFVIVWKDYNCEAEFEREWGLTDDDFANKGESSATRLYWENDLRNAFITTK